MTRVPKVALAAAVIAWAALVQAQPAAPPASAAVGVDDAVGTPLPLDARFDATDGRTRSLGELLGKGEPALLVLAYNRCEMLCSLVLRALADLVRELSPADGDFSVVTVSIDPSETIHEAARMRAVMLERAGLEGRRARWEFLVGDRPEIDRLARALGFRYAWDEATEQYAHPAVIYAISREGRVAAYFHGLDPDPRRVREALDGTEGWTDSGGIQGAILSCFRFDSAMGRYGSLIERGFAAGAAAIGLAVLGLVAWLLHRERRAERRRAA